MTCRSTNCRTRPSSPHTPTSSEGGGLTDLPGEVCRLIGDRAASEIVWKDQGLAFHDFVGSLGNSRELSLARTKIEEAVMWAVKHITA